MYRLHYLKKINKELDEMKNFKLLSKIILPVIMQAMLHTVSAQFSISNNQRYLLKDGKPFFWPGGTVFKPPSSGYG